MHFELKWLPVVVLVAGAGLAGARQQWEEEPGYREVNPGGEVVMVCRVRDKRGECRWERDNTPIAAYPGKYEWAGRAEEGDCSLRILAAKHEYDNGAWVCQVTASSFRERDTLISHPANLVVRGELGLGRWIEPSIRSYSCSASNSCKIPNCRTLHFSLPRLF